MKKRNEKEILYELSISVACLLDSFDEITEKDIHHIQDLITRLEIVNFKRIKRNGI